MIGTIARTNHESYGFIKSEDGVDYFFHKSALRNCKMEDLEQGRGVTFEAAEGDKGPRAEDVHV